MAGYGDGGESADQQVPAGYDSHDVVRERAEHPAPPTGRPGRDGIGRGASGVQVGSGNVQVNNYNYGVPASIPGSLAAGSPPGKSVRAGHQPKRNARSWAARRLTRPAGVVAGGLITVAAALALLATSLSSPPRPPHSLTPSAKPGDSARTTSSALPPLTVTTQVAEDPCLGGPSFHVVPPSLLSDVGPLTRPYVGSVARRYNISPVITSSPDAVYTVVVVNLQGKTTTAVVINDMSIKVVSRAKPTGAAYQQNLGGCGGMDPAYFYVNLDSSNPHAVAVPGSEGPGITFPATPLPYEISSTDPGQFRIEAVTNRCDCEWYAEIEWTSLGKTGWVKITSNGHNFRTIGTAGIPVYTAENGPSWSPFTGQMYSPKP